MPASSRPVDGAARRARRTRAAGAAASLALHVVVLGWLGLHAAPALRPPPPPETPPLTVELVRDTPHAPAPREAAAVAASIAAPLPPREVVAPVRPRPAAPAPREVRPPPLPPPPVPGAGTRGAVAGPTRTGPVGAGPAPGPLPAQEAQGDLRGFLRSTVGCSHEAYLRLTPAERARCDAGFATAARSAPAVPLPDDKLAAFARGAEANERRRARREGSLEQPFTGCEIGSAAASKGLGCLPPGAMHTVAKF